MTGRNEYLQDIAHKIDRYIAAHPQISGFYGYVKMDKSLNTVYGYLCVIKCLLDYAHKQPNELTLDDFLGYMSSTSFKPDGTPISASHKVTQYHGLKAYSTYLFESGVISKNYMSIVKRPKDIDSQQTIEKREKGFLNKKEIKCYIDAIKNGVGTKQARAFQEKTRNRDLAIIMIFLTTGIRISALMNLDINDIDISNNILRVTDKGSKVNVYNLNTSTLICIHNWLIDRKEWLGDSENNALFISIYGNRLKRDGIAEVVKKYSVNIEGKHITPHKLRATYGTQLYEATNDIYFVQHAMGHTTPTVTERYIRGQKNVTKKASDIMSSLI